MAIWIQSLGPALAKPGMVVRACNPSAEDMEMDRNLQLKDQQAHLANSKPSNRQCPKGN